MHLGLTEEKAKKAKEEIEEAQVKPTKPLSTYNFYCKEMCAKVGKSLGMSGPDAMKKVAADWSALTEADKTPFLTLHNDDEKR